MFEMSLLFKRSFINYERTCIAKIHGKIVETGLFKNELYKDCKVLYSSVADYIPRFVIK